MEFKQSKTYQNLQKATKAEMVTSSKYRLFGEKAREEGYIQIGNVFDESSGNELAHAELWIRVMNQGRMTGTMNNLTNSIEGERKEYVTMYQDFAKTADEEGYLDIARLFKQVAAIEERLSFRFEVLYENMKNNMLFCKEKKEVWLCLNCGNLVWEECAPEVCPVCGYPRGYFERNCENY